MFRPFSVLRAIALVLTALVPAGAGNAFAQSAPPAVDLKKGDTVVFVGGTLAERLQHFNHFETLLMARFPDLQLKVRNLGWSGDTITLQPRPLNFGDMATHLERQKADVILAFFGTSESFAGEAGLARFRDDLAAYVQTQSKARYNGESAPRLVLVSPIAHEPLPHLTAVNADLRNQDLERYTAAMRDVAQRSQVPFVDLFAPSRAAMQRSPVPLTDNGMHLNEAGDRVVASLLMDGLGFTAPGTATATPVQLRQLEALRAEIARKNQQFFFRWRPLNAEYVVGRRVEPFGSVSFPPEMRQLEEIVMDLDNRIWKRARAVGAVRFPPPTKPISTPVARPGGPAAATPARPARPVK